MATIQGVYITALGMAILFLALLVLMLAAMALERLFRPKKLEEEIPLQREKEAVAAIAVAIALKLKAQSSNIQYPIPNTQYQTSEEVPSSWKLGGRYRQLLSSRRVKRHQG
jgi:Na+-transporting methylmalonyl-CoA/oxaloacetate decarboxylase gamma subunit